MIPTARIRRRVASIAIVAVLWLPGRSSSQGAPGGGGPLAVSYAARALEPGEAVLLTFTAPAALSGVSGTAFGQTLAAYAAPVQAYRHRYGV